jgi:copper chaperone CopZ
MSSPPFTQAPVPTTTTPHAFRRFALIGLTCTGEALCLERRLRHTPGVVTAIIDPVTTCAYLVYDSQQTELATLITVIQDTGYGVR